MQDAPRDPAPVPEADAVSGAGGAAAPGLARPGGAAVAGRSWWAWALFLGAAASVLGADLSLKYFAFERVAGIPVVLDPARPEAPAIPPHDPIVVVPGALSLKLTTNTGAVFGQGQGLRWVFIVVSVAAAGVIGRLFWVSEPRAVGLHLSLALVLGGALGNLYDRWYYAAVRDMLWLLPGTRLWPWIFNLADAALMVGVAGIMLVTWRRERRRRAGETARG